MMKKYKTHINIMIIISTLIIIINFGYFVIEKSSVQYSDWLINYQGGFVRRGLPGEFFLALHNFTKIHLDLIVFIFVGLFYFLFAIYLIMLLSKIRFNFLNLFILFSPLSIFYPVMEQKVSGRKDVLFILSMILLATYLDKIKFENQKYLIIFLSVITTFSHSGFFVYLPIFLLIFIAINSKYPFKDVFKELFIISISCATLFFIIIFNTTIDNESILRICNTIKTYLPKCGNLDYISTLSWSLEYEIELVRNIWTKENFLSFYSIAFILANVPLIYAFYNSEFKDKKKLNFNPILIFILANFATLPIYFIGADYGRYMYITYVSLSIFYFKSISNKFLIQKNKIVIAKNSIAIVILFLFGFIWTVPHCCNNDFKFIYQKPITKIVEFYKN